MTHPDEDYTSEPPRRRESQDDDLGQRGPAEDYTSESPELRGLPRHNDPDGLDDFHPPIRKEMSWMDRQFAESSLLVLVLLPLCCGLPAFVFALVGVIVCEHPTARWNAFIVLNISIVVLTLGFYYRYGSFLLGYLR